MKEKQFTVPINFNGSITVTANSLEEAEKQALDSVKAHLIDHTLGWTLAEANIWTSKNCLNVGNQFFEMMHDLPNSVSHATLTLKPSETQFGAKSLTSSIRVSLSEYGPALSAISSNGTAKVLALLKIYKGELHLFHADSMQEKLCATSFENLVSYGELCHGG